MRNSWLCLWFCLFLIADPLLSLNLNRNTSLKISSHDVSLLTQELMWDSFRTICSEWGKNSPLCRFMQFDSKIDAGYFDLDHGRADENTLFIVLQAWRYIRSGKLHSILNCIQKTTHKTFETTAHCLQLFSKEAEPDLSKEVFSSFLEVPEAVKSVLGENAPIIGKIGMLVISTSLIFCIYFGRAIGDWEESPQGIKTSHQTKINIMSTWALTISVYVALIMAFVTKLLLVYSGTEYEDWLHQPYKSFKKFSDGANIMKKYANQNTLMTFLTNQRTEPTLLYSDNQKKMTYEEWNDPKREEQIVDAVRMLVKYFYVTKANSRLLLEAGENVPPTENVEGLLKKIYDWRSDLSDFDQIANTTRNFYFRRQDTRNELRDRANVLEDDLKMELMGCWKNMKNYYLFEIKKISEKKMLGDFLSLSSFALALGMFGGVFMSFIGHPSQCVPLLDSQGSLIQGIQIVTSDTITHLPYIYHSPTWRCTTQPNVLVSVGTTCQLVCEQGYTGVQAITTCDDLGGEGISWSHLNAHAVMTNSSVDRPTCCESDSQASSLHRISVSLSATDAVFTWTEDGAYYYGCGSTQSLVMQACLFQSASNSMDMQQGCTQICNELDDATHKCISTLIDLPFASFTGRSLSIDSLSNSFVPHPNGTEIGRIHNFVIPTTFSSMFRITIINKFGTHSGPWKILTQ